MRVDDQGLSGRMSHGVDAVLQPNLIVGILGGMGPVASAEFVKTIYEEGITTLEQHAPTIVLYSDPSFPDRTDALLAGNPQPLLGRVGSALQQLRGLGASAIIPCCVTVHHLLPWLPSELRESVVSVLDVAIAELSESRGVYLMMCSSGTRAVQLFERQPNWNRVSPRVVFPDDRDQDTIHTDIINAIKRNAALDPLAARVDGLLHKYGADGFVVGCTEMHVLAKYCRTRSRGRRIDAVDPLMALAQQIRAGHLTTVAS